ncbi:TIGR00725 family protein [Candidatus Woesearchaeota archaeon]|nr:MAG: TIGR00725 family protein [Candidatus Woesearchaeota archaeon]
MKKLQIGVVGSTADLSFTEEARAAAEEIGREIAKSGNILVFGAEKDFDSLPTVACRSAKRNGGLVVGVTYGKGKNVFEKDVDVIIPTGLERGGGREFVLVLCCDAIITISGGSGTLSEICVAYQANIPIIALQGFGGWSDKIAGSYLDGRKRSGIVEAKTAEEAVKLAIKCCEEGNK